MLLRWLHRLVVAALIVAVAWYLDGELGGWAALGCVAALGVVACLLGVMLLRQTSVGQITWKNRAAIYLLPWGYRMGGGRLGAIAVWCVVGWVMIAAGTLLALRYGPSVQREGVGGVVLTWFTWACWGVLGSFTLLMLRRRAQMGPAARSTVRGALWAAAFLGASVVLRVLDWPTLALIAAAAPIVLVLLPMAALLLVVMIYTIRGKPLRWN